MLVNHVASDLSDLAKFLNPDSPRNYAGVMEIKNGQATMTDGFMIGFYRSPYLTAEKPYTLNKLLQPSPVTFPAYDSIIPREPAGFAVDAQDANFLISLCKLSKSAVHLSFDKDGTGSLTREMPRGSGYNLGDTVTPLTNAVFNGALALKLVKVLPKGFAIKTAAIEKRPNCGYLLHLTYQGPRSNTVDIYLLNMKGEK